MDDRPMPSSDVAFSPAVKAVQLERGSRDNFADMEASGGFRTELVAGLADFLSKAVTAYLATASAAGQPYVQHRGGPPGFIQVLGEHTIGFADYAGNRQYISTGNISENERVAMIVMDYAQRRRIKLWGRARFSSDPELMAKLRPTGYRARVEQALLIEVDAWDVNCTQHIPQLVSAENLRRAVDSFEAQLAELRAENAELRAQLAAK